MKTPTFPIPSHNGIQYVPQLSQRNTPTAISQWKSSVHSLVCELFVGQRALPLPRANDVTSRMRPVTGRCAELRDRPAASVTILSVGDDAHLLESRQRVLESKGYRVRSVSRLDIVGDEEVRQVALAVICHSVEESRAAAVAVSIRRRNPDILVLRLATWDAGAQDCFDHRLACLAPGVLLATIDRMLAARLASPGLH